MSELIDRQAFIEQERKLYCEDCDRRKGTKNGKSNVICYEIGEAPCRACWLDDALTDLEDAPTIDAVPVRHGEWEQVEVIDYDGISMNDDAVRCTVCRHVEQSVYWARTYYHYCPNCGARMDGGRKNNERSDHKD